MIDVGYITYNKKQYPVRVSYFVLKNLKAKTGKDIEDADTDISLYEDILYLALQAGAKYTGQEIKFKEDEMEFMLDQCFWEFIRLIPQFFAKGSGSDTKKKSR